MRGRRAPSAASARPLAPAPVDRAFYDRSSLEVAPDLLGRMLVTQDGRTARIVEVEAYCGTDDPASHAFRGRTARNATMWGPPGHLYTYLSYGVHWCANAVCGPEGWAGAVLLRAAVPEAGLELMRAARWRDQHRQVDRDLCRGPGRLGQAFGLGRAHDGADLVTGDLGIWIADDGGRRSAPVVVTPRIGLSQAADRPWRFLTGDPAWWSGPPAAPDGSVGTDRRSSLVVR